MPITFLHEFTTTQRGNTKAARELGNCSVCIYKYIYIIYVYYVMKEVMTN